MPPTHTPPLPGTEPPVVLHLIPNLHTGGAETMMMRVQERIMQRGDFQPLICGMKAGGTLQPELEARHIPVRVLGIHRHSIYNPPAFVWGVIRSIRAVRRIIRECNVRVVQSHLSDADLFAIVAGRMDGVPSVLTHQSSNIMPERREPGFRLTLRAWVIRVMYRYADALISVSPAVTDALIEHARVDPSKIHLIYNAVDVPGKPTPAARKAARKLLGVMENAYAILCTARLVENKGQEYLIRALGELESGAGGVHVFFIGDGEDRERLEALARNVPAPHRVTFLGLRRDVGTLLAGADLFCLPSMWEGLSVSLLEALAQEVPVLATSAPGIRDTVTDNVHALLVPLRDASALAAGIDHLRSAPDHAARLAADGCALVAERYSLDAAATDTEHLYAQLIARATA